MTEKELVIKVLNRAIEFYKERTYGNTEKCTVTNYDENNLKIASYIERHPGWIKLFVTLEKGTGYFFLKTDSKGLFSIPYIAWEEDSNMFGIAELLKPELEANRNEGLNQVKTISSFIESCISKCI